AVFPVVGTGPVGQLFVRTLRADCKTFSAIDALILKEHQFRIRFERFRVVAPPAVEWTSFENHRRANARPVVDSELLYVEDQPLYFLHADLFSPVVVDLSRQSD
ncbi:MAG: hypothetical protein QGH62_07235, partial [Nitrospinaceae bacterium]|nr:hypothetical protein [Nitrospinaceae bacterium]